MLKVNSCILHASSSVRGSSLNYCTCPGLNGILFPSCLSWPWFIGYTMLWERLCLLQQSLYAITNTQIATRAAGSGPLPEDEQLLLKSSTAFPKSMGMQSGWPCSLMVGQDCWGGQGAHGATATNVQQILFRSCYSLQSRVVNQAQFGQTGGKLCF